MQARTIQTGSIKTVSHQGWPLIHWENTAPPLRPNRQACSVPWRAGQRQARAFSAEVAAGSAKKML
jgi:hypothetical protein